MPTSVTVLLCESVDYLTHPSGIRLVGVRERFCAEAQGVSIYVYYTLSGVEESCRVGWQIIHDESGVAGQARDGANPRANNDGELRRL